ncbi:hypothetical protein C8Q77DRAFT_509374 [Trametes polyzona]|nr:hypothetical protein C8Q77DRAFT_509374 [Trametes polyzona]
MDLWEPQERYTLPCLPSMDVCPYAAMCDDHLIDAPSMNDFGTLGSCQGGCGLVQSMANAAAKSRKWTAGSLRSGGTGTGRCQYAVMSSLLAVVPSIDVGRRYSAECSTRVRVFTARSCSRRGGVESERVALQLIWTNVERTTPLWPRNVRCTATVRCCAERVMGTLSFEDLNGEMQQCCGATTYAGGLRGGISGCRGGHAH